MFSSYSHCLVEWRVIHQSFKSAKMTQLAVLGLLIVNKMGIGLAREAHAMFGA